VAADVTLFDLERSWTVTRESIYSKSKNSPFVGKKLAGRVVKTLVGGVVRYDVEKGIL
jgi:dihydroorotase-like cyclic amidohydrolase